MSTILQVALTYLWPRCYFAKWLLMQQVAGPGPTSDSIGWNGGDTIGWNGGDEIGWP